MNSSEPFEQPHVRLRRGRITAEMFRGATEEQYSSIAALELEEMKLMQAYIAIRGSDNSFGNSAVPAPAMKLTQRLMKDVHEHRVELIRAAARRLRARAEELFD